MFAAFSLRRRIRAEAATDSDVKVFESLRASLIYSSFIFVIGVTVWIFGAAAIGTDTSAFFYIFSLGNIVLGVFVILAHLIFDPEFVNHFRFPPSPSTLNLRLF